MKRYKVVLHDGREEFVVADDYQLIDDEYKFFSNGSPVSDVFFKESAVEGIKVDDENYDPDAWRNFVYKQQIPFPDYGTWDP